MTRKSGKEFKKEAVQTGPRGKEGLYAHKFEHGAGGVVFSVNKKGRKANSIISGALQILGNLAPRGAGGGEPNTGDGAGILIHPPHISLNLVPKEAKVTLPAS